jgi:hypothetical protein
MTHSTLEQYLASLTSQLVLPAHQARRIILELRTHLYADFADRVTAGQDQTRAAQEAIAEMGGALDVAMQFNQEHGTQGAALRTLLALEVSALGLLFGLATMASCWRGEERIAAFPLALSVTVGSPFLAGYIARRRGWAFGLAPPAALLLLPTLVLAASGVSPPANTEPLLLTFLGMSVVAAIAGSLGSGFAVTAGHLPRASATAVAPYLGALIVAVLISPLVRGRAFYDVAAPTALGILLVALTWAALWTLENTRHADASPAHADAAAAPR